MNINKLVLFFIFLSSILNTNCLNQNLGVKQLQDYVFLLLFSDEQDTNHFYLKFGLGNLKKCHFPSGPSISNDFSVHEFCKVDKEIWQQMNNSSINLSMFCIEEPVVDINGQTKFLKKCGFELPGDKNISYLFDLDNNFHNIKGVIILNSEFDKILNKQLEEFKSEPEFSIEVPEEDEDIKKIDMSLVRDFKKEEDSRFVTILKKVGGFLCTQFYATSDAVKKYKKKLIEFFRSVHSYPSTSSGRTD